MLVNISVIFIVNPYYIHHRFTLLDTYYIAGELCYMLILLDKLPISQGLIFNGGDAEIAENNKTILLGMDYQHY